MKKIVNQSAYPMQQFANLWSKYKNTSKTFATTVI